MERARAAGDVGVRANLAAKLCSTAEKEKQVKRVLPLVLVLILAVACTADKPHLSVNGRMSRLRLEITNPSDGDWQTVTMTIRTKAGGTAFRKVLDRIKTKETITLDLVDFSDDDGNRFSPLTQHVDHVTIDAYADGREASAILRNGN
jgi:hypothetical protein